jgi:hypothetical protein
MSDTMTLLLVCLVPMVATPLLMNWIASSIEAKVEASRSWTRVDGTITRSKAWRTKHGWHADIRYTYSAHGEQHKGRRYCFGGFSGKRDAVQEVVERYPEGAVVPIYYDPSNPGSATIERISRIKGLRSIGWMVSGGFLALLVIGLIKRSGLIF